MEPRQDGYILFIFNQIKNNGVKEFTTRKNLENLISMCIYNTGYLCTYIHFLRPEVDFS